MRDLPWTDKAAEMRRKGFSETEIVKARPRKIRRDKNGNKLEYDEQKEFVRWVRKNYPQHARRLISVENAAHRGSLMRASMAQASGMVVGASDLFFRLSCGGFHGLWIEMKKIDGRPTPDESRFQDEARCDGYAAVVCKGCEEAKVAFQGYLSKGET